MEVNVAFTKDCAFLEAFSYFAAGLFAAFYNPESLEILILYCPLLYLWSLGK